MDLLNGKLPRSLKSIFASKAHTDESAHDHEETSSHTRRRHIRSASVDTANPESSTPASPTSFRHLSTHTHSLGEFIRSHYRSPSASRSPEGRFRNRDSRTDTTAKSASGVHNRAETFSAGTGSRLRSHSISGTSKAGIARSKTTPATLMDDNNPRVNTHYPPGSVPPPLIIHENRPDSPAFSPSSVQSSTSPESSSSSVSRQVPLSVAGSSATEGGAQVPDAVTCKPPFQKSLNSDDSHAVEPVESDEIDDASLDSDDHEDDEDVDNELPTPVADYAPGPGLEETSDQRPSRPSSNLSRTHSHMHHADAESIIGGIKTRISTEHTPHVLDETVAPTSERKTFSFSLPFGNPLASIEFRSFRPKLSSLFGTEGAHPGLSHEEYQRLQIDVENRLTRQLTVSSVEETNVYNTIKQQDNTRLRAIRQSLTPNITIESLNPLSPPKTDTFPAVEGDVVILGGYRGSILRDRASGRRLWIPIKAGFNLRKIDLTVPPRDEDEYNMINKVYPDGMLSHIGPIDISRKLIKKLRAHPKCRVYEFGYDWRLSSDINSDRLVEFLKTLPSNKYYDEKSGRRKGAIVIAHSMGGLVAHHAMQQDPTLFRGLVYAGAPSSCPNILGPLRFGDSVLMSSKILTRQVNFLMRSSYVFLPLDGRCFVNRNDTSIKYDLDFFDVNTWIKYELSPLVVKTPVHRTPLHAIKTSETLSRSYTDVKLTLNNITRDLRSLTFGFESSKTSDSSEPSENESKAFTLPDQKKLEPEEAIEYLDRTLKRTKKFLLELEYDPAKADLYPPLATLYSYSVPTLKGSKVDSPEGICTDNYDDLLFGAGDGVVYHKWTMPEPKGFSVVARVATDRGHVGLLTDVDAAGRALAAILEAEKQNLGHTEATEPVVVPAQPQNDLARPLVNVH